MISRDHKGPEADAADWVVRLSEGGGEAEWLAFRAWLDAAPGNRAAFDEAQAVWLEIDRHAAVLGAEGVNPRPAPPSRRWSARRPSVRGPGLRWFAPLAATLAALFVGVAAYRELAPIPVEHRTGPAERRTVALADGTKVSLNGNSRIVVRYNHFGRKVELSGAEAAFDVTPDPRRPFTVAVNDATVRVVGTEFNVRRDGGDFTVTVRRGVVQVAPRTAPEAQPVRLVAGQQLVSHAGQYRLASTAAVDDAFSWRQGQLVYRMRPLAEVVADLNRYYSRPIVLDPGARALKFSGVLALDGEDAVVSRLCELLPLQAAGQNGSIMLEARQAAH